MSDGKRKSKLNTIVQSLILFFIPFALASFYCLLDGKTVFDVSLLNSEWNDELFYYKLTDNILHFGYPRGYFGFNESHAEVLSFAAWSPVLLLQWIIFGAIFGWGFISPILSNLLMLGLSLAIFGILVKPSKMQIVSMAVLLGAFVPFSRFALSCLPEAEVIAIAIIYFAIAIHSFEKKEKEGFFTGSSVGFLYFFAALLTLMRPYLITLFLLPFIESFSMKRKKRRVLKAFLLAGITAICTLGIYYAVSKFLSAPYLIDLFYTDWITAFRDGFVNGLAYFFEKLYKSFMMVKGLIASCATHQTFYASGIYYLIFLILLVISFALLIISFVRRNKGAHGKRNAWIWLQVFISMVIFFVADMEMYRIQEGGRHTFVFSVVVLILVSTLSEGVTGKKNLILLGTKILLACGIFCFFVLWGDIPYEFSVPYKTKESLEEYRKLSEALSEKIKLNDSKAPGYDNTIIWDYGTDYTSFQCFYAVPTGFGINMCVEEYIEANIDNLESRYIGTVPGSLTDGICFGKGYERIVSTERFLVYKRY